jgi:hypothetical protein
MSDGVGVAQSRWSAFLCLDMQLQRSLRSMTLKISYNVRAARSLRFSAAPQLWRDEIRETSGIYFLFNEL